MTMDAELVERLRQEAESHQTVYDDDRRRKLLFAEAADYIAALKAQGWRPISEAKKSPTSILVWCPDRQNQYIVTWMAGSDVGGGCWCPFGSMLSLSETPTHFQPLPPAPDDSSTGDDKPGSACCDTRYL